MAEASDILRTEKHYILTQEQAAQAISCLSNIMLPDSHCVGQKPYPVRSVYFGSAGEDIRGEFRLRRYGDCSGCKLEWKEKQSFQHRKHCLPLSEAAAQQLISGGLNRLEFLTEEPWSMLREYSPKTLAVCERLAFVCPINGIRITFDSQHSLSEDVQAFWLPNAPTPSLHGSDKVVLGVKYSHFLLQPIQLALEPWMQETFRKEPELCVKI